ncbi:M23 family peptidase, partial [Clostridium butyricum]|nr:M23 family peptidase [Clostridium butyricum]
GIEGIAALNDRGAFVSVAPPAEEAPSPKPQPQAEAGEDEDEDSGSGPRLYQSLYETAARHDLPRATVEDIVRVF